MSLKIIIHFSVFLKEADALNIGRCFSCYITSKQKAYYVLYIAFLFWARTIRSAK